MIDTLDPTNRPSRSFRTKPTHSSIKKIRPGTSALECTRAKEGQREVFETAQA